MTLAHSPTVGSGAETQKTEASNSEQGDEHPLTGAEARAVSGLALTAGDQAGQPGQAPAAGHRSESESSHAH